MPLARLIGNVPEHAEPTVFLEMHDGVGIPQFETVVSRTEERELVIPKPLQELKPLLEFVRRNSGHRRRTEFLDQIANLFAHGLPVFDGSANIRIDAAQRSFDGPECFGFKLPRDLDMDKGFERHVGSLVPARSNGSCAALGIALRLHDGVKNEVDREVQAVQRCDGRIEQERTVGVQRFHHSVWTVPSILFDVRVVGTNERFVRGTNTDEAPRCR